MLGELDQKILGNSDRYDLEHRCYNGVCLTTAIGCWLAAVFNLFVGIPPSITIATAGIGLVYFWLYIMSRWGKRTRLLVWLYVATGVVLLALLWIFSGGLDGSGTIVSMAAVVAGMVVLNRGRLTLLLILFLPLMSLLFWFSYRFPGQIVAYESVQQRFLDLYFSLLTSICMVFVIIELILRSYQKERAHLHAANQLLEEQMAVLNRTNVRLEEALSQVKELTGLLPICASCKKIRDDKGYWNQLERYISDHSKAEFSHSLCPECAQHILSHARQQKS